VKSQLSLRDPAARLEVIEVLGELGSAEPVPALVEILRARDPDQSKAAGEALKRIGASAVDPLVDALGTPRDRPLIDVLNAIGAKSHDAIHSALYRYGLEVDPKEKVESEIERLHLHLFQEQRARLMTEIDRALELGREASYTEAFNRLDAVFAQDSALYMSFAKPIAALYVARGRQLFARGDYDATIQTVRTGLSIQSSPEAIQLLTEAQLQLAQGLIELGDLDRAQQTIESIQSGVLQTEVRKVEGHLLAKKARTAIDEGDYGRARTLIDRARAIHAEDPDLEFADRRLMLSENLAVVIVLSLLFPAFVLAVVLYIRRRLDSMRMERLAIEIDRAP
jgi:tetratricopeptide (TPR) repeat protein